MDSSLTTSFYNELAAVPSLHVGFAVAVGIAIAAAVRNPAVKLLALLWGPVIGLAVVATGNHFVFDIAAGVVASALGYGVGIAAARAGSRVRGRRRRRPRCGRASPRPEPQADRQRDRRADHGQHRARADEEGREPARPAPPRR